MGPSEDMERTLLRPLADAAFGAWDRPEVLDTLTDSRLQSAATMSASLAFRADFYRRRVDACGAGAARRRAALVAAGRGVRLAAKRATGHAALSHSLSAAAAAVAERAGASVAQSADLSARASDAADTARDRLAAAERAAATLEAAAAAADGMAAGDALRTAELRGAAGKAEAVAEAAVKVAAECVPPFCPPGSRLPAHISDRQLSAAQTNQVPLKRTE